MEEKEYFGESFGPISIMHDGYFALHTDSKYEDAFVRGIHEYSSGNHRIQFVMEVNELTFLDFLVYYQNQNQFHKMRVIYMRQYMVGVLMII